MPIVALAFVGLFVSRYLAAYQLGHIDGLWDPVFGPGDAPVRNGSEAVVTSWVSKGFPVADAGLGAFAYGLDILAGTVGDRRRWRTMPWMTLLFGLLVVPLGAVSVTFIIIQPPLIGALCTLCILQAAVTVVLIPYAIDEVLGQAEGRREAQDVALRHRPAITPPRAAPPRPAGRPSRGPDRRTAARRVLDELDGGEQPSPRTSPTLGWSPSASRSAALR
jgi:uncharacterized membrane protein